MVGPSLSARPATPLSMGAVVSMVRKAMVRACHNQSRAPARLAPQALCACAHLVLCGGRRAAAARAAAGRAAATRAAATRAAATRHYVSLTCPRRQLIRPAQKAFSMALKSENACRRAQMPASYPRHLHAEWWNALHRPSSGYLVFADDAGSHPCEGALAGTRTLQIPTDTVRAANSPASHPNSPILGPPREPSQKRCPFLRWGQKWCGEEFAALPGPKNTIIPAFAGIDSSASAVLYPAEFNYVLMDYVKIPPPPQVCAPSYRTRCSRASQRRLKVLPPAFLPPAGW
jgi:hypothetical protein